MGRGRNASRAPRATKAQVRDRAFIIDMLRQNGRRFVTSVRARDDVGRVVTAHRGKAVVVSHWEQRGGFVYDDHPLDGWHLVERFSL